MVVGDIGFHGPPEPGPRAVVEIGYAVVPAWQGRGVATRACALMLEQAWRDGADLVQAEAGEPGVPGGAAQVRFPAPRRGLVRGRPGRDRVRSPGGWISLIRR